jgi:hypothetical protein
VLANKVPYQKFLPVTGKIAIAKLCFVRNLHNILLAVTATSLLQSCLRDALRVVDEEAQAVIARVTRSQS